MLETEAIKELFVEGAISPSFLASLIDQYRTDTAIGAYSIFLGQVRADGVNGQQVRAIEYSAYEPMAMAQLQKIIHSISRKYSVNHIHIRHSRGLVRSGEICLLVFVSSVHRHAAVDACHELVEKIKSGLPIWGKELIGEKDAQWKQNN